MSICFKSAAGCLLACALVFGGAARANVDAASQEFVAALQRLKLHQPDAADSPALKAYPIYDYLVAARLRRDLMGFADERLDARVEHFLQAHPAQPVSRPLLHDWLASLAERGHWDVFLNHSAGIADPVLACQRLSARLPNEDESLAPDALARWMLAQKPPPQCAAVFAWLHQRGLITAEMAESRTRAALLTDAPRLARDFAEDIPAPRAIEYLRWSDLLEAPRSALNVLATHPALSIDPEALAAGFDKFSRQDGPAALSMLPELLARDGMSAGLRSQLKRSAALGAAYSRDPRAVAAFQDLGPGVTETLVLEWRARAAIWAADFGQARRWIVEMPAELGAQPRWRYWYARALETTDGAAAAEPVYTEIAGLRDYYGYLAADRLHLPYHFNVHASPDDMAVQAALATEPGLTRARELFVCDLTEEAIAEWNAVMAGAGNALKVQAAQLASRWGWYTQAITTLAQSGEFDDVELRYPRPYQGAVDAAAKLTQLPPDWIWAVMRQESLFRKDAVSHADARGLMQMLPLTAVMVARRWHLKPPSRDALFEPAVAVPLGAAYLRELLGQVRRQHGARARLV